MCERLPRDTIASGIEWPRCPWCKGDMDGATVSLGALADAWQDRATLRPWRGECGQPDPGAITTECPSCGRPSMVALQVHAGERVMRLLAVRTKTDVELLGGTWGKPL